MRGDGTIHNYVKFNTKHLKVLRTSNPFVENWVTVDTSQRVVLDHDYVNTFDLLIFDLSTEHWGFGRDRLIERCYDAACSIDKPFIVLSHRPEHHLARPSLFYLPSECVRSNLYFKYDPDQHSVDRKYLVSCLNHYPRSHRVYNWCTANTKSWYTHSLWTMHNDNNYDHQKRSDEPRLPADIEAQWISQQQVWPSTADTQKNINIYIKEFIWNLDHPAYKDSYLNIITEHSVIDGIYMSEKTWKPIASGQLFVTVGNPGSISQLRAMGVDVFDDIVDHNYYDTQQDWICRICRMQEVVDDLVKQDLKNIYISIQDRLLENQHRFRSGAFFKAFEDAVQHQIFSICAEQKY